MPGLVEWLDPHVDRYLLLSEQEYIVLEVYKHWMASAAAWVRLIIAVPVLLSSWAFQPPLFWVLLVLSVGVTVQALYSIADEYRDRFVITNQRVFRVHGTFAVQRASVPLGRILDITVKKPLVGRIFNYGHFVFESAAQVQGLSEVRFVRDIDARDRTLQETMQRAGLRATAPQLADDGT
ncbi:PH domain-containing protein [uncultured Friedmanniella sp.]|uniref:PH domain-containing protein n=1 Tax=uncultured Friedmanniella sp. TaxID=335381 RepID=UPI0035C95345